MLEPHDLLRTGIASARSRTLHGALPYRAQSPRARKPTAAARIRHSTTFSRCSRARAPPGNAQLLLLRDQPEVTISLVGHYAVCNMAIEAGARVGLVAVDQKTID